MVNVTGLPVKLNEPEGVAKVKPLNVVFVAKLFKLVKPTVLVNSNSSPGAGVRPPTQLTPVCQTMFDMPPAPFHMSVLAMAT